MLSWIKKFIIGGLFLFCALTYSTQVYAQNAGARTLTREYDAITIKGEQLPPLIGAPVENIRVYAVENGKFVPVPFQVDEKNNAGKYSLAVGNELTPDEDPRFDTNDEIVFMAVDGGPKADNITPPDGAVGNAEVQVIDPRDNTVAYFYIFGFKKDLPALSDRDYVNADFNSDCTYAAYYTVCSDPGTILYNKQSIAPQAGGKNNVDYIDRMKMRIKSHLKLLNIDMNIDESDFVAKFLGQKDGPVRVIKRIQIYFKFVGGVKIKTDVSENIYYYGYYMIPKFLKTPIDISTVSDKSEFIVFGDFNNAMKGNKFITSLNYPPVEVDGKMDETENSISNGELAQWVATYGPNGNIITQTTIDKRANVVGKQFYCDNANLVDPPEGEPGCYGCFGMVYDIINMAKGDYWFRTILIFPKSDFTPDKANHYLDIENKPLKTEVKPYGYEKNANKISD